MFLDLTPPPAPPPHRYLSRVDLLRQLVSSRSARIPSIQELTKPDLARRVRDRLIEDDRFGLAMEVSTKCQLDTGAVWAAWGMACLQCGDFTGARSKFRHCFQVSYIRDCYSSGLFPIQLASGGRGGAGWGGGGGDWVRGYQYSMLKLKFQHRQ